jgi:hypothetical protein
MHVRVDVAATGFVSPMLPALSLVLLTTQPRGAAGVLNRLLSSRPFAAFADITYDIYLLHPLVSPGRTVHPFLLIPCPRTLHPRCYFRVPDIIFSMRMNPCGSSKIRIMVHVTGAATAEALEVVQGCEELFHAKWSTPSIGAAAMQNLLCPLSLSDQTLALRCPEISNRKSPSSWYPRTCHDNEHCHLPPHCLSTRQPHDNVTSHDH